MQPVAEPGYQTTEFWASQAASLIAALILVLTLFNVIHWTPEQKQAVINLALIAIAIIQAAYALARGIRKAGTTNVVPIYPTSTAVVGAGQTPNPTALVPAAAMTTNVDPAARGTTAGGQG